MSITRQNFDEIGEADLIELVANGVPEGLHLEFKEKMYGSSDDQANEALKDISAFANMSGGHLIIGIREEGGIAIQIKPLEGDIELFIQRIDNYLRDSFQPRIMGCRVKAIDVDGGRVIVVRIPRSWSLPHRVSARNRNRFYIRNSSGAHEASIEELRSMFNSGAALQERIDKFRADRLSRISQNTGPAPLSSDPGQLVVHVVPLASLAGGIEIDITQAASIPQIRPIRSSSTSFRYNFDGFLVYRIGELCRGYTQIFRNGAAEGVDVGIIRERQPHRILVGSGVVECLKTWLPDTVSALSTLGVPAPFIILITLTGTSGTVLGTRDLERIVPEIIRDQSLHLPGIMVNSITEIDSSQRATKPAFDALWNAGGYPYCDLFGE